MLTSRVGEQGDDAVHDPGMIGAVDRQDAVRARVTGGRDEVADRPDREPEVEPARPARASARSSVDRRSTPSGSSTTSTIAN